MTGAVRVPAGGGRRSDAACRALSHPALLSAVWRADGGLVRIWDNRVHRVPAPGRIRKQGILRDRRPASSDLQRDWGGYARVTGRGEIESATGLSGVGETSPAASRWGRGRPRDRYARRCTLIPTTTFNHLLVIHLLLASRKDMNYDVLCVSICFLSSVYWYISSGNNYTVHVQDSRMR